MESNDKLEKLLRQMYTLESLHDNDIDTSDIVDEADVRPWPTDIGDVYLIQEDEKDRILCYHSPMPH